MLPVRRLGGERAGAGTGVEGMVRSRHARETTARVRWLRRRLDLASLAGYTESEQSSAVQLGGVFFSL